MTHFVYLFASSQERDLNYSIRSIKKFWQGDYKIFIIGKHSRLRGVKHIIEPLLDSSNRWKKQLDQNHKKKIAIEHNEINENFIVMHDDMIFIDETSEIKLLSYGYVHDIVHYDYSRDGIDPAANWRALFVKTMKQLRSENLPTYNYETHYPRWYNKQKIRQLFDKYNLNRNPFNFASLYYNNFFNYPEDYLDKYSAGIYLPHKNIERIKEKTKGKHHINYNERALSKTLESEIKRILK